MPYRYDYQQSGSGLWTVYEWDPTNPHTDYANETEAAETAARLNGLAPATELDYLVERVHALENTIAQLCKATHTHAVLP